MNEKKSVNWKLVAIRTTYWIGVILDFFVALVSTISLISKDNAIFLEIFPYRTPSSPLSDLTYTILVFETALMWGWTALLIWADRKPIERRGVLLLTIFPVTMMLVFNIVGVINGQSYISLVTIVIQFLIIVLFIVSSVFATKLDKTRTTNTEFSDEKPTGV